MNGGYNVKNIFSYFSVAVLTGLALTLFSGEALAVDPISTPTTCGGSDSSTIGKVICATVENAAEVPGLLSGLSYLFGLVIGIWAIAKLYEHVQNPHQVSVWEPSKRALAAGALFALPMIMEVVHTTMAEDNGSGAIAGSGWAGDPTGGGLDAMVVALVTDVFTPMSALLWGFCYLGGIILCIVGVLRLLKSAQEGPRGPGGFGTIMTFIVAGALFSVDQMLGAWSFSLFGTETVAHEAGLNFDAGLEDTEREHILSVISAILGFVMILGWVSFIRGWFIIRDVAEGSQQASLMAGLTHLFGGALAVNLGPVLNAVQETFGLSAIGVNFN